MIKKKTPSTWPWLWSDLAASFSDVEAQANSTGKTRLLFQGHNHGPIIHLRYGLFGKIQVLLAVSSKSFATSARNSFCSCDRSPGTNFAATRFLPRSSVRISETIVRGIPSASSNSRTVNRRFFSIAACTRLTFSGVLLVESLAERGSLSTDS